MRRAVCKYAWQIKVSSNFIKRTGADAVAFFSARIKTSADIMLTIKKFRLRFASLMSQWGGFKSASGRLSAVHLHRHDGQRRRATAHLRLMTSLQAILLWFSWNLSAFAFGRLF